MFQSSRGRYVTIFILAAFAAAMYFGLLLYSLDGSYNHFWEGVGSGLAVVLWILLPILAVIYRAEKLYQNKVHATSGKLLLTAFLATLLGTGGGFVIEWLAEDIGGGDWAGFGAGMLLFIGGPIMLVVTFIVAALAEVAVRKSFTSMRWIPGAMNRLWRGALTALVVAAVVIPVLYLLDDASCGARVGIFKPYNYGIGSCRPKKNTQEPRGAQPFGPPASEEMREEFFRTIERYRSQ